MINESRIKYQFNSCEQAIREVLHGLFSDRLVPPDRTLADFFRSHRSCGSRDRAFINSCVYALLRRWGWVRRLMPQDFLADIEAGKINLQRRDIAAMTGFSLICDNAEQSVIREILNVAGVDMPDISSDDAAIRASQASVIFGQKLDFDCNMLAPDFRHLVPDNWDYDSYMFRLSRRPPVWIRFASGEGKARACREFDTLGIRYVEYGNSAAAISGTKLNLFLLESFNAGFFEVQDLASQCVGSVCAPKPGERWYDACAGAGGKTLHLAALMAGKGKVTSGDIRENILESLKKRARRAGWANIQTRPHDGGKWNGKHQYDGVLVDAPCSGSGVWRRNVALQWRMTEDAVKEFAVRQLEILENNAPAVKHGGALVYATCSIFEMENEQVAYRFLERNPDFYAEEFNHPLSGEKCCGAMRAGCGVADCDELFAFKMRRK